LIFIDGNHDAPAPLNDAIICEQLAEADALILFHDLTSRCSSRLGILKAKSGKQSSNNAYYGGSLGMLSQLDISLIRKLTGTYRHICNSILSVGQRSHIDEFREILTLLGYTLLLSEARLFHSTLWQSKSV